MGVPTVRNERVASTAPPTRHRAGTTTTRKEPTPENHNRLARHRCSEPLRSRPLAQCDVPRTCKGMATHTHYQIHELADAIETIRDSATEPQEDEHADQTIVTATPTTKDQQQ